MLVVGIKGSKLFCELLVQMATKLLMGQKSQPCLEPRMAQKTVTYLLGWKAPAASHLLCKVPASLYLPPLDVFSFAPEV